MNVWFQDKTGTCVSYILMNTCIDTMYISCISCNTSLYIYIYRICIMQKSCMYHVYHVYIYISCMYIICIHHEYIMYISCIYYVYIMHLSCTYHVYIMYIYHVYIMHILCIYHAYIMYISCIYHAYIRICIYIYISCIYHAYIIYHVYIYIYMMYQKSHILQVTVIHVPDRNCRPNISKANN